MSVWDAALRAQGVAILDGGLATELERAGFDLRHQLWSARVLVEHPEAIVDVHRAYLEAGADCIVTASYQVSRRGLEPLGLDLERILRSSVELAVRARDEAAAHLPAGRSPPLVAASVGPLGAALADGSEYRGDYRCSEAALTDFHAERWSILVDSAADLIACETIPSAVEVACLVGLFESTPSREGWISVSCRDGAHLCDGTPVEHAARAISRAPAGVAMGINCTAPRHVAPLLERIGPLLDDRVIVVYPNSGEIYDAQTRSWRGDVAELEALATRWRALGARVIGGCCRTGPAHVAGLRRVLTR